MSNHDESVAKPHKHPNYLFVFIVLAVLTAILTGVELMHQSGVINWLRPTLNIFFLSISVIKAILVAMFYMHLKTESFLYAVLFGVPVWFAVVFLFALEGSINFFWFFCHEFKIYFFNYLR